MTRHRLGSVSDNFMRSIFLVRGNLVLIKIYYKHLEYMTSKAVLERQEAGANQRLMSPVII